MSDAHNNLISVIAGHVDRIGYTFGRAEACLKRTGERGWGVSKRTAITFAVYTCWHATGYISAESELFSWWTLLSIVFATTGYGLCDYIRKETP